MSPAILDVKESTMLGPGAVPVAVLNVKWSYGNFGPFTLQTNWAELNSGAAMQKMQQQAALLGQLPKAQQ